MSDQTRAVLSKAKTKAKDLLMLQKSLKDMITGLRAAKSEEADYMAQAISDIHTEIATTDAKTKAVALQKLLYLHMTGVDMSWAAFHAVEAMSQPRLVYKHIGYQAACQSFHQNTDVLILLPNLLKKDLASNDTFEVSFALDCLSNLMTQDLARDLVGDVFSQLNSPRSYIRKKSVLVLYKTFLHYPEALRPAFGRLTEKLEDEDPQVASAVVGVLCELCMHNPKNYLPLAPTFYKLLQTSSNNWMTIKLVKIFGVLTPHEPRLVKKLVEPIKTIMKTTPAKSLLYECIRTVCSGMITVNSVVALAIEKLQDFMEESDPNLKFLALKVLKQLLATHPRAVAEHKATIFACLAEGDHTIQSIALELVKGMANRRNLTDTVGHLLVHLRTGEQPFLDDVVAAILDLCGGDRYALLTDFQWYLSVLVEMARVPKTTHGYEIGKQLMDLTVRVDDVHEEAVRVLRPLVLDPALLEEKQSNKTVGEALNSAAWITGEYSEFVTNKTETIEALLQPQVTNLPAHSQRAYVQAVLKVFASAAPVKLENAESSEDEEDIAPPEPEEEKEPPALALVGKAEEEPEESEEPEPEAQADKATEEEETTKQEEEKPEGDEMEVDGKAEGSADGEEAKEAGEVEGSSKEEGAEDAEMKPEGDAAETPAEPESKPEPEPEPEPEPMKEDPPPPPVIMPQKTPLQLSKMKFDAALVRELREMILANLKPMSHSADIEVAERSAQLTALLNLIAMAEATEESDDGKDSTLASCMTQLAALFAEQLNPVSAKAQKKVPVPAGLDLNAEIAHDIINMPSDDEVYHEEEEEELANVGKRYRKSRKSRKHKDHVDDAAQLLSAQSKEEEMAIKREARERLNEHKKANKAYYLASDDKEEEDKTPQTIALDEPQDPAKTSLPKWNTKTVRKAQHAVVVKGDEDEGLEVVNDDEQLEGLQKQYRDLDIDITAPLDDSEELPTTQAYPLHVPSTKGDDDSEDDEETGLVKGEKKRSKKDKKDKKEKKEKKDKKEKTDHKKDKSKAKTKAGEASSYGAGKNSAPTFEMAAVYEPTVSKARPKINFDDLDDDSDDEDEPVIRQRSESDSSKKKSKSKDKSSKDKKGSKTKAPKDITPPQIPKQSSGGFYSDEDESEEEEKPKSQSDKKHKKHKEKSEKSEKKDKKSDSKKGKSDKKDRKKSKENPADMVM